MATFKSIEQKAKRYDEALEMAKKLIENEETNVPVFYVNNIKDIFPELKESIDERIKKVIKQVLSESTTEKDECYLDNGVTQQEVFAWLEKQGEQKPTEWSDEDETALGDALWCCKQAASIAKDENDMGNVWYAETWLKSLKDRVLPQPKQEWSEEDKDIKETIIGELELVKKSVGEINYNGYDKLIDWLKSLRPQNTWKPSDEQMEALEKVTNYSAFHDAKYCVELKRLLGQLKAL